jgi:hypothetical protein
MLTVRFREYAPVRGVTWQSISYNEVTMVRILTDDGAIGTWVGESQMFYNATKTVGVLHTFEVTASASEVKKLRKGRVTRALKDRLNRTHKVESNS